MDIHEILWIPMDSLDSYGFIEGTKESSRNSWKSTRILLELCGNVRNDSGNVLAPTFCLVWELDQEYPSVRIPRIVGHELYLIPRILVLATGPSTPYFIGASAKLLADLIFPKIS